MEIKCEHNKWSFKEGSYSAEIKVIESEHDRGGPLGKEDLYGSSIVSSKSGVSKLIVTNPEFPNCENTLEQIINIHSQQRKLGTFGLVKSPHGFDTDDCILHRLNTRQRSDVDEYIQIPIYINGRQVWGAGDPVSKYWHTVYRRYDSTYYTTKIVRELETYTHPLKDGCPELNIIKRKQEVVYTSITAEPFDWNDISKYFPAV